MRGKNTYTVTIFVNGLITGLMLQLAIGPVFFFITNLALQKTLIDGFAAVFAVTLVDYLYIALAIFGIGAFLKRPLVKRIFGVIGPLVLSIFGGMVLYGAITSTSISTIGLITSNPSASFMQTFLITISSPMTIVFWTSLFASKASELNYSEKQLILFGFSTGLATPLFMGSAVIVFSQLRDAIPLFVVQVLNGVVGAVLIYYGVSRLLAQLKTNSHV